MKLVFDEDGSDLAAELWDGAETVASSVLVYPEARVAVAAAHRGGRIDDRTRRAAVRAIGDRCDELGTIGVDVQLAREAGELAERHGVRGYDAVHLAAALSIAADDVLVATWDRELAAAAVAAGHPVVPDPGM